MWDDAGKYPSWLIADRPVSVFRGVCVMYVCMYVYLSMHTYTHLYTSIFIYNDLYSSNYLLHIDRRAYRPIYLYTSVVVPTEI